MKRFMGAAVLATVLTLTIAPVSYGSAASNQSGERFLSRLEAEAKIVKKHKKKTKKKKKATTVAAKVATTKS